MVPSEADFKCHAEYISVGGNRHPAAADWDRDGTGCLAFGADNNIAIWHPLDENRPGVSSLLIGHTDTVNVVRFMRAKSHQATALLTGSTDKSIRVWIGTRYPDEWRVSQILAGHEAPISCMATLDDVGLFASSSSDGSILIWSLIPDTDINRFEFRLVQTITISPKILPLAVALASISGSTRLLAVAGTKNIIQIYASNSENFTLAASLSGHEGWIRALDFVEEYTSSEGSRDLLLASASQDKYIRLWRIHQRKELPAKGAANDPILGLFSKSLSNKAHQLSVGTDLYSITFEALLLGHEDWVYTARWQRWQERLQLLTASADNSLAVWEADPASGIWVCAGRLGEISAQKGSTTATGSTGGFWLGLWSPKADAVVSLGRTGGWRLWKRQDGGRWKQDVAVTGHTKEVKSIAWSRDGAYLLSTGSDQTTRLHATWKRGGTRSWHEFSRPQIHGYDLNCIDTISNTQFISGADEKLLRVFNEPAAVADILRDLSGIDLGDTAFPDAANIPVLGLSNKAIEAEAKEPLTNGHSTGDMDTFITPQNVQHAEAPPLEDQLSRHLLWPETEKLYGHGYEISCVAASRDGTLVATACRASSIDHALIRLYDTKSWLEVKPALRAHSLTVTSLKFSLDDRYLLSVGRDRQWTLFSGEQESSDTYRLLFAEPKAHTRMILDCSWAPIDAGQTFATAGRDKTVRLWTMLGGGVERTCEISTDAPVTAVDIMDKLVADRILLAFGTETGLISVCRLAKNARTLCSSIRISVELCSSRAVTQLRWRRIAACSLQFEANDGVDGDTKVSPMLAVSSDDTSVRIIALYDPVISTDRTG